MTATPTGRLYKSDDGLYDLTLTRTFAEAPGAVWQSITDPEQTARWIGPWRGTGAVGATVELQLVAEEGIPWSRVLIEQCEAPHVLAVSTSDEPNGQDGTDDNKMELQIRLTERNGATELTFIHHLADPTSAGDMGPGWEYYLDRLVASRNNRPDPEWDDYYPAQAQHFLDEAEAALAR